VSPGTRSATNAAVFAVCSGLGVRNRPPPSRAAVFTVFPFHASHLVKVPAEN
jgi:hypothetical protein